MLRELRNILGECVKHVHVYIMWKSETQSGMASERQSNFCNKNLVEDEQPVIMVCNNYNDSRKEMLEKLAHIFPKFTGKVKKNFFSQLWARKMLNWLI